MTLNSVNIMGNLTRDPESKTTPSGKTICNLSIANNRVYTKNNEKVTEVSYFDIEVWGVMAANGAKYLSKGNGIIVEGRLKQDRWEKDGKTQSRVRIVASSVHFLPKKKPGEPDQSPAEDNAAPEDAPAASDSVAWDE
ncbi:MAG: single-stranded DNA-binding protein [Candidatus Omnitrophica bacterium]|nr:single-stranded DNA-binding protein [Candidatus Omnitrophota bacterium]